MNNTNENSKLPYSDTVAVLQMILIIFVLMGHNGVSFGSLDGLFVYDSFHMPLFIAISGYLFHTSGWGMKEFRKFVIKKLKRLLIPFILWDFVYGMIAFMMEKFFGFTWMLQGRTFWETFLFTIKLGGGFFELNSPSWFVLALFEVAIIFYFINQIFSKSTNRDVIVGVLLTIIACFAITYSRHFDRTLYCVHIVRVAYLLFWYELGYLYRKFFGCTKEFPWSCILFSFILQFVLVFLCGSHSTIASVFDSRYNNNAILTILLALNGACFYIGLSRVLTPILGGIPVVKYI